MNWSNFISHVTFTGRFVSPARVEGTYHESITGEDCTWDATNASPQAQALAAVMRPVANGSPPSGAKPASSAPHQSSSNEPPPPPDPTPETLARWNEVARSTQAWKAEAEADTAKLLAHQGPEAKSQAIRQFCAYAPDQNECAARIGDAYEYLMHNAFGTMNIASHNKAMPLPAMQPAAGEPSYYDVYQVFAFLTRSER
jgi:hypothetical protein